MFIPIPACVGYILLSKEEALPLAHPRCAGHGITYVLYQGMTESNVGTRLTRKVTGAARYTASGE